MFFDFLKILFLILTEFFSTNVKFDENIQSFAAHNSFHFKHKIFIFIKVPVLFGFVFLATLNCLLWNAISGHWLRNCAWWRICDNFGFRMRLVLSTSISLFRFGSFWRDSIIGLNWGFIHRDFDILQAFLFNRLF